MWHRSIFLLAALAGAAALPAQVSVTGLTYLGVSGYASSEATGINDAGVVVGTASSLIGDPMAFRYSGGTITEIGSGYGYSMAQGINGSGQITGRVYDSGFIYQGTLTAFDGGVESTTRGLAINASGHVVGDTDDQAFVYDGSTMTRLGFLGEAAKSVANGINASGQIVGESGERAFLYSGGLMTDLGSLGEGGESFATGINATGLVVGRAESEDGYRAFLYSGGVMSNLGTLGGSFSEARAINDAGLVVGVAEDVDDQQHAFLYANGAMFDLHTLAASFLVTEVDMVGFFLLDEATALNEFGQIVGSGMYFDGSEFSRQAFMLTVEVTAIPEPSTYAGLFGAAVLGFACWRRRRVA
jgi:probable HAF family extracellular repeat protein